MPIRPAPRNGEPRAARPRYVLLDELRGLAVAAMVVYHAFFLLGEVFGSAAGRELLRRAEPVQPFIAGTFIFICGICCRLSRSNRRRGLRLLGLALLLTLCTWALTFMGIHQVILFGVLHFLAVAILLFHVLEKPLSKAPPLPQALLFAALFLLTANLLAGGPPGIGFGPWLLPFPSTNLLPLFFLGFPSHTLGSADYIPLIPWLFLFLAGTAVGIYAQRGRFPACFEKPRCGPLRWVGRHALLIYLLHQPVLFGLAALCQWIFK